MKPLPGPLLLVTAAQLWTPATRAATIALEGATVHTVSHGVIEDATVLVSGDRIEAVGTNVDVPAGATRITLANRHVYPGLIDMGTLLGVFEIRDVRATRDERELGQINPNLRIETAFNPASELLPVARADGVLAFLTYPSAGLVSGTAALAYTAARDPLTMVLRAPAALVVNWPPMSLSYGAEQSPDAQRRARSEYIRELDDAFDDAEGYLALRAANDEVEPDVKWEAMRPVLSGEIPVLVRARGALEIRAALDWAEERDIAVVIETARDVTPFATELAARDVPVILSNGNLALPRGFEPYDAIYRQAAELHAAGVRFAFATGMTPYGTYNARQLPDIAGLAVAHALPAEAAIRALTLSSAEIAGVGDRLGSVDAGKEATFIVTDGDVLEIRTRVLRAWVAGEEVSLESRHVRLYERYRDE